MNKYNGWTNKDTWAADLWLTGDEGNVQVIRWAVARRLDAAPMRDLLIALIASQGNPDGIDYDNVNWAEVIEGLQEV